jgi:hypothetical protein
MPTPASAGVHDELSGKLVSASYTRLPDTATSNSAGTVLTGVRGWRIYLGNGLTSEVTNALVTIDSGRDPSLFDWNGPVTSFPVTKTTPTLASGQEWDTGGGLASSIPVSFQAGYDSTRTVDPAVIPAGGGRQEVTVTVTPVDDRYDA